MKAKNQGIADRLDNALSNHIQNVRDLPGITPPENRAVLLEQLVDSVRRVKYVEHLAQRRLSAMKADASSGSFDPLAAAVIHYRQGNIDEACWLVFLAIHFGKHHKTQWNLTQAFYSALNQGITWDWNRAEFNPDAMVSWLANNYQALMQKRYKFGNHRKYESLNPRKKAFTGKVLKSYVLWVQENGGHQSLFQNAVDRAGGDPAAAFKLLYKSMNSVFRFGRTGRFDYLSMISNMGISPIKSGSTYMGAATGPFSGAKLLFFGRTTEDASRATVDKWLIELDSDLSVGMQVIEDALCNWQKSPGIYKPFR